MKSLLPVKIIIVRCCFLRITISINLFIINTTAIILEILFLKIFLLNLLFFKLLKSVKNFKKSLTLLKILILKDLICNQIILQINKNIYKNNIINCMHSQTFNQVLIAIKTQLIK